MVENSFILVKGRDFIERSSKSDKGKSLEVWMLANKSSNQSSIGKFNIGFGALWCA